MKLEHFLLLLLLKSALCLTDISQFCDVTAAPEFLSILNTPFFQQNGGTAERFELFRNNNNLVGVSTGPTGFRVADITVPTQPGIFSAFSPLTFSVNDAAILRDDMRCVVVGTDQGSPALATIVLTTNATLISTVNTTLEPERVTVTSNDQYVYVSQPGASDIFIYNITDFSNPTFVRAFSDLPTGIDLTGYVPGDMNVSFLPNIGEVLLTTFSSGNNGVLLLFSIDEPENPTLISQLDVQGIPISVLTILLDIQADFPVVAVAGENRLALISLENPLAPVQLSTFITGAAINSIRNTPDDQARMLVADVTDLELYDVSDLSSPSLINILTIPFDIRDFDTFANMDPPFFFFATGTQGTAIYCTGNFFSVVDNNESEDLGLIVGLSIGIPCFVCCIIAILAAVIVGLYLKDKNLDEEKPSAYDKIILKEFEFLENIQIGTVLGKGQFGKVYKGKWGQVAVALKSLNSETNDFEEFKHELETLRTLDHPYIIRCYGLFKNPNDKILIVFEFMAKGDLLSYIQKHSETLQNDFLSQVGSSIAIGMEYLHSKNVIHRDLACRNILLSANDTIKIADFGLSRHSENYYKSNSNLIPVRWASPEAIRYQKYSTASDIWAYGVVLYEIFSLGLVPYHTMDNLTIAKKLSSKEDFTLEIPENTPEPFPKIMKQCWAKNANDRPSFSTLNNTYFSNDKLDDSKGDYEIAPLNSEATNYINSDPANVRSDNYNLDSTAVPTQTGENTNNE